MPIIHINSNGEEKALANRIYIDSSGNEHSLSKKIYIDIDGNEHEIWGGGSATYLGLASSFNLKLLAPKLKYDELTVDDFFVSPRIGTLGSWSYSCRQWDGSSCIVCQDFSNAIGFSKTYNRSNGIFNCSFGGDVYAWVIPKSNDLISKNKIINLGSNTQFDVSSVAGDYQKLTVNNFLFRNINSIGSQYVCCARGCENWIGFDKTYDKTTGVIKAAPSVRRIMTGTNMNTLFYISSSIIKG